MSLHTALGSNSELSQCCRESCDFTFAERKEPSRDIFSQEFSHFNGPDHLRIDSLLVIHGTVLQNIGASVNERIHSSSSNSFVVGSFSFFKNMRLGVEEESAYFW